MRKNCHQNNVFIHVLTYHSIAIVGGRKNRDAFSSVCHFVAFRFYLEQYMKFFSNINNQTIMKWFGKYVEQATRLAFYLMRSYNIIEVIGFEECFGDVGTELDADATLRWRTASLRLRVRPQEIAHDS